MHGEDEADEHGDAETVGDEPGRGRHRNAGVALDEVEENRAEQDRDAQQGRDHRADEDQQDRGEPIGDDAARIIDLVGTVEGGAERFDRIRGDEDREERRERQHLAALLAEHFLDHGLQRAGDVVGGDSEQRVDDPVGLGLADKDADQRGGEDEEREDRQEAGERDEPGHRGAVVAVEPLEALPEYAQRAGPVDHGKRGAAMRPVVSSRPSMRLAFCRAWPEEPLVRLSRVENTITRPGRRSGITPRCT